jgi:hypothetical protein
MAASLPQIELKEPLKDKPPGPIYQPESAAEPMGKRSRLMLLFLQSPGFPLEYVFTLPLLDWSLRGSDFMLIAWGVPVSIRQILFSGFSMAFIMSMCMSFVMTLINLGLGGDFVRVWLASWGIGFVVSLPLSFFLPLFLQKIMKLLKI